MADPAAITGAYVTRVGEHHGTTSLGLHYEAATHAAADAGLALNDIDGVLCAYSLAEPHPMLASAFCGYAGMQPAFSAVVQAGGASAATMVVPREGTDGRSCAFVRSSRQRSPPT